VIPIALERSYRHCERITRANAANFYYGIRLLPRSRRRALCAIYALARRIDDVADGDLAAEVKLRELARARAELDAIDARPDDPVLVALADAARRYPIPLAAFADLVEGAELDVHGTRYRTFPELARYCRCVAGSIGRLTLGVLEVRDRETAERHAVELGVALQLTNILRDLREDSARGRVYLPEEDLERFGCLLEPAGVGSTEPAGSEGAGFAGAGAESGPLPELIRFEADRAREWLDRGLQVLPLLDRQGAACVGTMAGIYGRVLARIERDPALVLGAERVSLAGWEKGWVAVRSLTAGGA
jgi:phytoene synthase